MAIKGKDKSGPVLTHQIGISEDSLKDLTLLLLGLMSFKQRGMNQKAAYKGHNYRIIDLLRSDNMVHGPFGSNLIYLTEDGIKKVEELRDRFGV